MGWCVVICRGTSVLNNHFKKIVSMVRVEVRHVANKQLYRWSFRSSQSQLFQSNILYFTFYKLHIEFWWMWVTMFTPYNNIKNEFIDVFSIEIFILFPYDTWVRTSSENRVQNREIRVNTPLSSNNPLAIQIV